MKKWFLSLDFKTQIFPFIKTSLIPKFEIFISKIERVTSIFIGQVESKSQSDEIFQSNFLHVNLTFIDFKITFSNMGSQEAFSSISGGWALSAPPTISWDSETPLMIGLIWLKGQTKFLSFYSGTFTPSYVTKTRWLV